MGFIEAAREIFKRKDPLIVECMDGIDMETIIEEIEPRVLGVNIYSYEATVTTPAGNNFSRCGETKKQAVTNTTKGMRLEYCPRNCIADRKIKCRLQEKNS